MAEPLVIVGGGLAGLSAAYHSQRLKQPYLLFERESRPGGLVRSHQSKGFTFDYTGHLLHLAQPRTRRLVLKELGLKNAFVPVKRDSWVYSHGVFTRAPYQANAFGLPPSVVRENVDGFLKAWVGARAGGKSANKRNKHRFLASWAKATFGEGIYKNFFKPYNSKLWGIAPEKMTTSWMGRFVPQPDLERVLAGALRDQGAALGYNANFLYPKKGGIETLAKGFSNQVACVCDMEAARIHLKDRILRFADGQRVSFGRLISSMPLTRLVSIIDHKPKKVVDAARQLRASSVLNVNLGFKRNISDKQWIYVPGEDLPFYRVGFYHNFSKALVPKGGSSAYIEISHSRQRPLKWENPVPQVLSGLARMGLIKRSEKPAVTWVADIPNAYVQYDVNRDKSVSVIQGWLKSHNIQSVGRWGNWEYGAMEDAIWQGAAAAGWKE